MKSPKSWTPAILDGGWQLLGNWHSHPELPARPSREDIRLVCDSRIRYLILSLMDPAAPVLHAFQIEGALVEKERIVYDDER